MSHISAYTQLSEETERHLKGRHSRHLCLSVNRLIQSYNLPTNTALIKHHSGTRPLYVYLASDQWGKTITVHVHIA